MHAAYLKLVDAPTRQQRNSRGHFFGAAAESMRRILVDKARRKKSDKRGGQYQRIDLNQDEILAPDRHIDLIALDEALSDLVVHDWRKAELVALVILRYGAGKYFLNLPIWLVECAGEPPWK